MDDHLAHLLDRRTFLKGTAAAGLVVGTLSAVGAGFWFDDYTAWADVSTLGLPSGTAPEQVHLTWGTDPTTAVTVSWATPGATPQPAPSLAYSTAPITAGNPGTPATVQSKPYTDGMNTETVNCYHAPLIGLTPATTYFYEISDGATSPTTFSSSFTTAASVAGRPAFTFTSFGDLGTPTGGKNASGQSWAESSDNSFYAVRAVESVAPLFHLLNGDLCYANLNTNNQPEVWRDFGINNQFSAANRPWMPCLGNHEIEFGTNGQSGAGPGIWNGRFGY